MATVKKTLLLLFPFSCDSHKVFQNSKHEYRSFSSQSYNLLNLLAFNDILHHWWHLLGCSHLRPKHSPMLCSMEKSRTTERSQEVGCGSSEVGIDIVFLPPPFNCFWPFCNMRGQLCTARGMWPPKVGNILHSSSTHKMQHSSSNSSSTSFSQMGHKWALCKEPANISILNWQTGVLTLV
ncbi:insulin-like growth factor 2 mRNA-binding protein 1 [Platysternon megacephalum]|uniref:Insulin-like growth factor 2 mRNA-binding protein 1 n=1 Tax=Platysternon megacephalum TaxID=55544 RepID=A0A4D9EKK2_9SAUR|nr:insulin-like growth factor 2 mRNA-binding protein 1 [Platysternon megacephalum]